ncbi:MAG TPA: STAS domain-containing protein [Sumerlaeia bacterium]|nr:STAS domain-containing protein [Sumerlaeia bacterium]
MEYGVTKRDQDLLVSVAGDITWDNCSRLREGIVSRIDPLTSRIGAERSDPRDAGAGSEDTDWLPFWARGKSSGSPKQRTMADSHRGGRDSALFSPRQPGRAHAARKKDAEDASSQGAKVSRLWLDLCETTLVDSVGLGTLMGIRLTCQRAKVRFTLIEPSVGVMRVLKAAKLDSFFEIVERANSEVQEMLRGL